MFDRKARQLAIELKNLLDDAKVHGFQLESVVATGQPRTLAFISSNTLEEIDGWCLSREGEESAVIEY